MTEPLPIRALKVIATRWEIRSTGMTARCTHTIIDIIPGCQSWQEAHTYVRFYKRYQKGSYRLVRVTTRKAV